MGGFSPNFAHVLYCQIKLAFFLTVYLFGSCFRMLAAILVSDLKKKKNADCICVNILRSQIVAILDEHLDELLFV